MEIALIGIGFLLLIYSFVGSLMAILRRKREKTPYETWQAEVAKENIIKDRP